MISIRAGWGHDGKRQGLGCAGLWRWRTPRRLGSKKKQREANEPGCRLIPTHSRFLAISLIYPKLDHDASLVTGGGAKLSILLGRPELSTVRRLQSRGRVDKPIGTVAKGGTATTGSSTFQSKYRALLLGASDNCFPRLPRRVPLRRPAVGSGQWAGGSEVHVSRRPFWSLPVEWEPVRCMFAGPVARDKKKGVIYREPEDCPTRRGEGAGCGHKASRESSCGKEKSDDR